MSQCSTLREAKLAVENSCDALQKRHEAETQRVLAGVQQDHTAALAVLEGKLAAAGQKLEDEVWVS